MFSSALHILRRAGRRGAPTRGVQVRLALVVGVACLLPALPARADIGPKPSMRFAFEYEIPRVAIASAVMLECQDAGCHTSTPLEEMGPQGFRCSAYECSATAYGFADFHRIAVTFDDGEVRESNVFSASGRGGDFVVTVSENTLRVTANRNSPNLPDCLPGWALTLVVETLVAGVAVGVLGMPRALLGVVPAASLLSLPVVWFLVPMLALPWTLVVALSELFAFAFETGFIYAFTHCTMSLRSAVILSALANGASCAVGLFLALGL